MQTTSFDETKFHSGHLDEFLHYLRYSSTTVQLNDYH
jgi:hypothetical protein